MFDWLIVLCACSDWSKLGFRRFNLKVNNYNDKNNGYYKLSYFILFTYVAKLKKEKKG